jgi:hypothetical protein
VQVFNGCTICSTNLQGLKGESLRWKKDGFFIRILILNIFQVGNEFVYHRRMTSWMEAGEWCMCCIIYWISRGHIN